MSLEKQLHEALLEKEARAQKISGWEQKHNSITRQLEIERAQLKKREDELK